MAKSADAFRTISEVAEWLETPAHVLRFWESKFSQVKPVKRAGGRRYYRPADMQLLGGIKQLLHEDGMTIKGVQKILRENGVKHVARLSQPLDEVTEIEASEMAVDVIPEDEPPSTAEVVSFRGGESSSAPTTPSTDEKPRTYSGTASSGPTATPKSETEFAASSERTDQKPEDEVDRSDSPTEAKTGDEDLPKTPPVMPSFLQRPKQSEEEEPEAAPEVKSEEPAPALVLSAPDIPDDPSDDAPAEPGPLNALARISGKVDRDALARMRELADQLGSGPG